MAELFVEQSPGHADRYITAISSARYAPVGGRWIRGARPVEGRQIGDARPVEGRQTGMRGRSGDGRYGMRGRSGGGGNGLRGRSRDERPVRGCSGTETGGQQDLAELPAPAGDSAVRGEPAGPAHVHAGDGAVAAPA